MSVAGLVERRRSFSKAPWCERTLTVASPTGLKATDERRGISRQLQRVGRSSVPPEVPFTHAKATRRSARPCGGPRRPPT